MKRIKQIIDALKILSDEKPSARIREALREVLESADGADGRDKDLLLRLIGAVIDVAEEMERPSKADSEVKS